MTTVWVWRLIILYAGFVALVMLGTLLWPVASTGEIHQITSPSHLSVRDFLALALWLGCVVATAVRLLIAEIKAELPA